jgi:hypothetical protein
VGEMTEKKPEWPIGVKRKDLIHGVFILRKENEELRDEIKTLYETLLQAENEINEIISKSNGLKVCGNCKSFVDNGDYFEGFFMHCSLFDKYKFYSEHCSKWEVQK